MKITQTPIENANRSNLYKALISKQEFGITEANLNAAIVQGDAILYECRMNSDDVVDFCQGFINELMAYPHAVEATHCLIHVRSCELLTTESIRELKAIMSAFADTKMSLQQEISIAEGPSSIHIICSGKK